MCLTTKQIDFVSFGNDCHLHVNGCIFTLFVETKRETRQIIADFFRSSTTVADFSKEQCIIISELPVCRTY